ncbi:MAG: peptidoglycan glycosyltransferase, partial [Opitutae bacterium]
MTLLHARQKRFTSLAWIVSLCFVAVIVRLFWLHWVEAPELCAEAVQARSVFQELDCRRGEVRDSQNNLLAVSEDVWDIGVDPESIKKEELGRAVEVAKILGVSPTDVIKAFNTKPKVDDEGNERRVRWIVLAHEVDKEVLKKITGLKIKALRAELKYHRNYPNGQLAAHVIGYVNKEGQSACGVEKALNNFLQGQKGWIESERDGRRREIASIRLREVQPVDGNNVILSINSLVQKTCEDALDKAVAQYNPISAVIIVSEPKTG